MNLIIVLFIDYLNDNYYVLPNIITENKWRGPISVAARSKA
jgi:hypothetical protein